VGQQVGMASPFAAQAVASCVMRNARIGWKASFKMHDKVRFAAGQFFPKSFLNLINHNLTNH
jgi:hypothetical protein